MIVVETNHAHVIKFFQCHFLGEKCGDESSIYFFLN
jgi:hypothetical protein